MFAFKKDCRIELELIRDEMTGCSTVVIEEEAKDTRAEVKSFDHSKLKHVETKEKDSVPTADGKEHHSKKCLIL